MGIRAKGSVRDMDAGPGLGAGRSGGLVNRTNESAEMFGQTAKERLNVRSRPLDDELDAAVVEVPNGAGEGRATGEIHAGGPETDALDASGEEDGAALLDHGSGDYSDGGRVLPNGSGPKACSAGNLAMGNGRGWFGDCSALGCSSRRRKSWPMIC